MSQIKDEITKTQWDEMARLPLKVLTPRGFEAADFDPRFELTNSGQLDEGTQGDAQPPERRTFQTLSAETGWNSLHRRNDWEVRTQASLVGNSEREKALRFAEKGEDALPLDLADYLVEVQKNTHQLSVGHINYGQHPLILEDLNHRGVKFNSRWTDRLDFSVSSMNGSSIVGFDNFFGLSSRKHNISAATLGIEVFKERPGALRLEMTYMNARVQSQADFDVGEVTDVVRNRGYGVKLSGSTPSQRLRGELLYSRSRFNNPYDPLLALAEDDSAADLGQQVAVKASTDSARRLALSYDLIQGKALSDTHTLSATVSLSHDQADPLYQSVGASVAADIEQNTADLSVQIGDLSVQGQVSQSENNLDNLSTVLKTRTRQQALSVFAPMGSIFGQSDTGRSWWPELAYSFARVHQFAANAPDPELSGFDDPAFLPDDISIQHSLDLGWNLDSWQFGVQFGYSKQDDRRNTQQQLDTNNMNYGLRAGWQATDRLRLDIDLGRDRNVDKAQALTSYFDQSGISLDWQLWEGLNVSGNYSYSRGHDELGSSETVDTSAFLQISKIFRYPLPAGNCPGRCFSVTQTRHRTTGSEPSVSPVAEVTGLSIPASASVFFKLFIFETFQMH